MLLKYMVVVKSCYQKKKKNMFLKFAFNLKDKSPNVDAPVKKCVPVLIIPST